MSRTTTPVLGAILLLVVSSCAVLDRTSHAPENPADTVPQSERSKSLVSKALPDLEQRLKSRGFRLGQPVFLRIFKQPQTLEVWLRNGARYSLFQIYPIRRFAGRIGPKKRQEDGQSPEGFYTVTKYRMNPFSKYHLGFNLGFPNHHDRMQGWSGTSLMVHGKEMSRGCYAMGDAPIEEIYALCEAALAKGQSSFSVHCLPFPLTSANLQRNLSHPAWVFWQSLRPGYAHFEKHRLPPAVGVDESGNYVIGHAPPIRRNGQPLSPKFARPWWVTED